MSPVDNAQYNSKYSKHINQCWCTAEMCKKVLKYIQDWTEDLNGTRIYWMKYMAGTSKMTNLYSLCEWLVKNQQLGGNYFCSCFSSLCCDMNNIVPTLTSQLARYSYQPCAKS